MCCAAFTRRLNTLEKRILVQHTMKLTCQSAESSVEAVPLKVELFLSLYCLKLETSRVQRGPNTQMGSQQRITRNSCDASRHDHVHTSDKQWRLTSLEQLCKIKMWKDVRVSWIIYRSELVRVVDRLPVIRKMSGWRLNFLLVLVVLYTSGTPSPSSHHIT